ncbi:hypothetical protein ACFE04_002848 [Oxalis oulophora]
MCSYCGHISKRPVLDLQFPSDTNSGIIKDLVGKGGKLLNGKGWSDNTWMCGQDSSETSTWVLGSITGKSSQWRKSGGGIFGGDENCLAEKSYSGVVIFACNLLSSFCMSIIWLWRKIFRFSSSGDDSLSDSEHSAMLSKRGGNGTNYNETRGEKARRKAEEKKQARLEKELLEEEERKQREEVAKLVEERRKLRDEKMGAEKDRIVTSPTTRDKDSKKEAERKRQEKRKEKDKPATKGNSDVDELKKRAGKETDRKRDSEVDRRENHKSVMDRVKSHGTDIGNGVKNVFTNNYNRGNSGTRYMPFSGSNFFGKGVVTKENKYNGSVDNSHIHPYRRDSCPPERVSGKSSGNGDDKNTNRSALHEPQARTAPKKSWQQLFTCSESVPTAPSNVSVISRPNLMSQTEFQNPLFPSLPTSTHMFDNPVTLGLPSPFHLNSYPSASSSLGFSPAIEPMYSCPEEPEHYEDPCYIPDPISLLGPVSESLDNFQLNLGTGFGIEKPRALKSVAVSSEVSKPSPIESPLSTRLRVSDEKPKAQDFLMEDTHANEKGTWQMWNSSPLGQDGLGLVGRPEIWLGRSQQEEFSQKGTSASLFSKEDMILPPHSPKKVLMGNGQNGGGVFNPIPHSADQDPWLQNGLYSALSGVEGHFSAKAVEENSHNEMMYGNSIASATTNHASFDISSPNHWPKKEIGGQGSAEGVGKSPIARPPHLGGLYQTPDVQSLWSF